MKKLLAAAIIATCAIGLSGCFSLVDWEHNLNHLKAWNQGMSDAHDSIDRFLFDYDKSDPTRSYGFETPNT